MYPASHELAVQEAAANLPPQQFAEFRKLARELAACQARWGLFLLQYEHVTDRDSVVAAIDKLAGKSEHLHVSEQLHPDWPALEAAISTAAAPSRPIQIFGLDEWLCGRSGASVGEARIHAWNIRREAFARYVCAPVLCWVRPSTLTRFALLAPDLWSWRTGTHDFSVNTEFFATDERAGASMLPAYGGEIDNRTAAQRSHRINEIRQFLAHPDATAPVMRAMLLIEMADLLRQMGSVDSALHILRDELLPMMEQAGDGSMWYLRVVTLGKIADVLFLRGELDKALRIRLDEEIPGYIKAGDRRSCAITQLKVADVLRVQGKFDEALHILQHDVQPFFEELGDLHLRAVATGKIADVLEAQEEFDAALKLRLEEELPVHQRLQDLHSQAITETKIVDVHLRRGQLTEALHILRDRVIPAFDRLGDIHSRTVAIGKIADAMRIRGELDEAIRIGRDELLPAFTRLGDMRGVVRTQTNIAADLWRRGLPADRTEIKALLTSAYTTAQNMRLPEASTVREWLQSIFLIENPDEDQY